ncbi:MAG: hypothetical protein RLZZ124_1644 [Cyanobacteriota bacterium]
MRLSLHRFPLTKAVPLAISRGSTSAVEHLLVEVEHDGVTGRGETGGFDTGHRHFDTGAIAAELEALAPQLLGLNPQPLQALEPLLASLSPPARCGLDLALHDWWGQRLEQPLHRLWGLDPSACVATSVTLGLGEPSAVLARLERWRLQLPATRIKLKLGSPAGVEHDRALVLTVQAVLRPGDELQVDANGGWDLATARTMICLTSANCSGVLMSFNPKWSPSPMFITTETSLRSNANPSRSMPPRAVSSTAASTSGFIRTLRALRGPLQSSWSIRLPEI